MEDELKKANDKIFSNTNTTNRIFVYTPPKVGSTSLVSSLRISCCNHFNIVHIHDEIMLNVLTGINNISILDLINYNKSINKNVFVIDIYRSPVERKISIFFENLERYHFNNKEENINNYNIERIINRFNKIFPYLSEEDYYFEKYNIQSQIPTGFDFEKKYLLQEINGIKYIKLRLKDSNEWGQILTTILQTEIVIVNDYNTENKIIGELYKKFKNEYKIPLNYYEFIKKSTYFNYYYSEKERNNYLNLWENKIGDSVISYTPNEYDFYNSICIDNAFYSNIQLNHYIDSGCLCKVCSIKRKEIFEKAKKGESISEKIMHINLVNDFLINKIQVLKKKKKIYNLINNNKNKNIKNFDLQLKL